MSYLSIKVAREALVSQAEIPIAGMPTNVGFIRDSISMLLILGFLVPLIVIIISCIQLVFLRDKYKSQAAKTRIKRSIVGLIVAFIAYFIISFISYWYNVNLLRMPNFF